MVKYIVMRPDSEPFLQIAQCIMGVSMKGRYVQPKNQNRCWYRIGSPPAALS